MKEKFLSWQGTKRRELFLSCCGFDSYISFVGKKLLSAFGTVYSVKSNLIVNTICTGTGTYLVPTGNTVD